MIEATIVIILAYLIIASFSDLKTREVPDTLSYSLIALGAILAIGTSIFLASFQPLIEAALGLVFGIVVGLIFYFTGQWGGGDAKLLMGLGVIIGLPAQTAEFPFLLTYTINIFLVGAIYGLIWILGVGVANFKKIKKALSKKIELATTKKFLSLLTIFVLVMIIMVLLKAIPSYALYAFMSLVLLGLIVFSLMTLVRVIEEEFMVKEVKVKELTEGDWIVDKKINVGDGEFKPKSTGISKKEIELLKKHKVKKVTIKEGVPFVPTFLIAFVLTALYGAWFLGLLTL